MASARHSDGPVSSWEKMANVVSWALRAHSKLQALVKDRNSRVPSGLFKEEKLWGFGAWEPLFQQTSRDCDVSGKVLIQQGYCIQHDHRPISSEMKGLPSESRKMWICNQEVQTISLIWATSLFPVCVGTRALSKSLIIFQMEKIHWKSWPKMPLFFFFF